MEDAVAAVRTDPLTGRNSVRVLRNFKSPDRIRTLPHQDPCPFCHLLTDEEAYRAQVVEDTPNWVVAQSTWSVLRNCGVPGVNEVVICKSHHTSFEEVGADQLRELFTVLQHRADKWGTQFSTTQMFGQVGLESGGSVSHLHAQVVASNLPAQRCGVVSGCGVCVDSADAAQESLELFRRGNSVAYLTPTPCVPLEVRVASTDHGLKLPELAEATWEVLSRLQVAGWAWPYNMILHSGAHPHLHLLARVDQGVVYSHDLALTFVPFDLHGIAEAVRAATPAPVHTAKLGGEDVQ